MPSSRSGVGGSRCPAAASSSATIWGSVFPPNGMWFIAPASPMCSAIALTMARRPAPELNRMVPSISKRTSFLAGIIHSPLLQAAHGDQPLAERRSPASREPRLHYHTAAGKRGMHQSVGIAGKSRMRNRGGGFAPEEQQIARPNSVEWNGGSATDLLGRIAGQAYAPRGKGGLNQAGAIDPPRRDSAPHVWAARKMLEGPAFRRFGASAGGAVLELSNAPSDHPSLPPVGQTNHVTIQNHPGAQRNRKRRAANPKRCTLTPGIDLGAPVLARRILHLREISQMDPAVVSVCVSSDSSPFAGSLQHRCGLSQNELGDLFGPGGGIRQNGRQCGAGYNGGHGCVLMRCFPEVPSSSIPDTA